MNYGEKIAQFETEQAVRKYQFEQRRKENWEIRQAEKASRMARSLGVIAVTLFLVVMLLAFSEYYKAMGATDVYCYGQLEAMSADEIVKTEPQLASIGTYRITHYCNCARCCGKWVGGPTASGAMPKAGRTIAVDTKKIPFGTHVWINGHEYVAEDRGGAIKGYRIDIFCSSHAEALKKGVYEAEVYVK